MALAEGVHAGRPLADLLQGVGGRVTGRVAGVMITGITADSRQVKPGALFVAVPGLKVDGHDFVARAVAQGCVAVVIERGRGGGIVTGQAVRIEVEDSRAALGELAAAFFGHPARGLRMIGITGTNGKTTTTYLLEALLRGAGCRTGVIGTVNYRYDGVEIPAPFTTPEPVQLQQLLREMAARGVSHVVMEVSSHGLAQKRLQGVAFDVALFTNLSRDHLDFHGDMEQYFAAKACLFSDHLKEGASAVIVREAATDPGEPWGGRLAESLAADSAWRAAGRKIVTCGMAAGVDVHPRRFACSLAGIDAEVQTPAGGMAMHTRLVGSYNLKNVLGAVGVGTALGLAPEAMADALVDFAGVPGRLERVAGGRVAGAEVLVDYAHTPDALDKVLETLRELTPCRLIVVFGCGGDRDRGKRPLMGKVAGRLADVVVVTSDNPRSEEPRQILADIEAGLRAAAVPRLRAEALLSRPGMRGYDIIPSRREAIAVAVRGAGPGDVVLIAGKGHECYQLGAAGKTFFDDRVEAGRNRLALTR